MSKRSEMIRFRVSAEEKAVLEERAGSIGVSAYLRQLALDTEQSVPKAGPATPDCDTDEGKREGRDSAFTLDRDEWIRQRTVELSLSRGVDARKIASEEWSRKHG